MRDQVALSIGDEDRDLVDLLDREIYAFNVETTGLDDGRMLTIRAVDTEGRLVAGLSGWTWGGCAYVDVLWVSAEHRRQGLGTRLMEAAEQEAAARGCTVIVLSTHTFQAPAFYHARGYVETGRTPDYPVGHGQIHLSRSLTGDTGEQPQQPFELATIPASAGAMVRDRSGRLLILKPTYKAGWTIPGGVVEADGETPWEACRRETREECGLDVTVGRLACVDFLRPRPGRPGGMRFLFDCGVLDDAVLAAVSIQPEEISEYRLVPLPEALSLLSGPVRRRVRAAGKSSRVRYLEDGRPVPGVGP